MYNGEAVKGGVEISAGRTRVSFQSGAVSVSRGEYDLTGSAGLNCALKMKDVWIDSSRGEWQLRKKSPNGLRFDILFNDFPFSLTWSILLSADGRVSWRIGLVPRRIFSLEEIRVVVLMNPAYTGWLCGSSEGVFPRQDEYWRDIYCTPASSRLVGATGSRADKKFPLFVFSCSRPSMNSFIQQAPVGIGANIAGFKDTQKKNKNSAVFFSRTIFSGTIRIFDTRWEMDSTIRPDVLRDMPGVPFSSQHPIVYNGGGAGACKKKFFGVIKLFRHSEAMRTPRVVQMELTDLKKVRLPENAGRLDLKQPLPMDSFEACINSLASMGTKYLFLGGDEDPLLHPRIFDAVATAKKAGMTCYLKTTGMFLNGNASESLIRNDIDGIMVDLSDAFPCLYRPFTLDFDSRELYRIEQRLKFLASLRGTRGKPYLCLHFELSELTLGDSDTFMRFAFSTGADAVSFALRKNIISQVLSDDTCRSEVLDFLIRIKNSASFYEKIEVFGLPGLIQWLSQNEYYSSIRDISARYLYGPACFISGSGETTLSFTAEGCAGGNIKSKDMAAIWDSASESSCAAGVSQPGVQQYVFDLIFRQKSAFVTRRLEKEFFILLSRFPEFGKKQKRTVVPGKKVLFSPESGQEESWGIEIRGDRHTVHNASSRSIFEFKETVEKTKLLNREGVFPVVTIDVTKFNFLSLDFASAYAMHMVAQKKPFDIPAFEYGGTGDLNGLFADYVDSLRSLMSGYNIRIRNDDPEVRCILNEIQRNFSPDKIKILLPALRKMALYEKSGNGHFLRVLAALLNKNFIGPHNLIIDTFHTCNLNCAHCWIHAPGISHEPGFKGMRTDLKTFQSIIGHALDVGIVAVTIHADGEPLLHPNFIDMVRYIKVKNSTIDVVTSTNGIYLHPDISNELVKLEFDEIYCSITGGTPEVFSRVCKGMSGELFNRIGTNLKYLSLVKGQLNPRVPKRERKPILNTVFVLHTLNYHDMLNMARFAGECGADKLRFQLIHLDKNNRHLKLKREEIDFIRDNYPKVSGIAAGYDMELVPSLEFQLEHIDPETGDWSKNVYTRKGCLVGWFFSAVKANGDVSLCCAMKIIDTIKDKTFKDVWNSSHYGFIRQAAKDLIANRDVRFEESLYHKDREPRGDLLYSDKCEHCDNHDHNNLAWRLVEEYGLTDLAPDLNT